MRGLAWIGVLLAELEREGGGGGVLCTTMERSLPPGLFCSAANFLAIQAAGIYVENVLKTLSPGSDQYSSRLTQSLCIHHSLLRPIRTLAIAVPRRLFIPALQ